MTTTFLGTSTSSDTLVSVLSLPTQTVTVQPNTIYSSGGDLVFNNNKLRIASTTVVPAVTDSLITDSNVATLTNKTLIGGSNGNVVTGTTLSGITVSGTPTANTVLTATSATTANWQALPSNFRIFLPSYFSLISTSNLYVNVTQGQGTGYGSVLYTGRPITGFAIDFQDTEPFPSAFPDAILFDVTNNITISQIGMGFYDGILAGTITQQPGSNPAVLQVRLRIPNGATLGPLVWRGSVITF